MWDNDSFESRSFEPGSWLFDALSSAVFVPISLVFLRLTSMVGLGARLQPSVSASTGSTPALSGPDSAVRPTVAGDHKLNQY